MISISSKITYLTCCLVLSIIIFSLNASASEFENSERDRYEQLKQDWWTIFPDGNRNAGGPKFFKYAYEFSDSFEKFESFNRLFCPVSGSLIKPNSPPEIVYVKEENSNQKICGKLYRCCWPCSCDVIKYVTAEKFEVGFGEIKNNVYLLKIKNPCTKNNFPPEANREYFCKGREPNLQQVHFSSGKMTIGMLHDAHVCSDEEIKTIDAQRVIGGFCPIRNNTPIEEIKGGMGDIFIKIAE